MHAFPEGLGMADIKSGLEPLGIVVDEQGRVLMRPVEQRATDTP